MVDEVSQRRLAFVWYASGPSDGTFVPLKYASKDAERVAAVLRSRFHYDVHLVQGENPYKIREQFDRLAYNCGQSDAVVSYVSCHGQIRKGELFLVLDNTTEGNYETFLPASDLLNTLDRCAANNRLLVIDCCHAGAAGAKDGGTLISDLTWKLKNQLILFASDRFEYAREFDHLGGSFLAVEMCRFLDKSASHLCTANQLLRHLGEAAWAHNAACKTSGLPPVPMPFLQGHQESDFAFSDVDPAQTMLDPRPPSPTQLERRYRSGNTFERALIIEQIAAMPDLPSNILPIVLAGLRDSDPTINRAATEILAKHQPDHQFLPAIVDLLDDSLACEPASKALLRAGEAAIPPLCMALLKASTRARAAALLREFGNPVAYHLWDAVETCSADLADVILDILLGIGSKSLAPLAEGRTRNRPWHSRVLKRLIIRLDESALSYVEALLRSDFIECRIATLDALAKFPALPATVLAYLHSRSKTTLEPSERLLITGVLVENAATDISQVELFLSAFRSSESLAQRAATRVAAAGTDAQLLIRHLLTLLREPIPASTARMLLNLAKPSQDLLSFVATLLPQVPNQDVVADALELIWQKHGSESLDRTTLEFSLRVPALSFGAWRELVSQQRSLLARDIIRYRDQSLTSIEQAIDVLGGRTDAAAYSALAEIVINCIVSADSEPKYEIVTTVLLRVGKLPSASAIAEILYERFSEFRGGARRLVARFLLALGRPCILALLNCVVHSPPQIRVRARDALSKLGLEGALCAVAFYDEDADLGWARELLAHDTSTLTVLQGLLDQHLVPDEELALVTGVLRVVSSASWCRAAPHHLLRPALNVYLRLITDDMQYDANDAQLEECQERILALAGSAKHQARDEVRKTAASAYLSYGPLGSAEDLLFWRLSVGERGISFFERLLRVCDISKKELAHLLADLPQDARQISALEAIGPPAREALRKLEQHGGTSLAQAAQTVGRRLTELARIRRRQFWSWLLLPLVATTCSLVAPVAGVVSLVRRWTEEGISFIWTLVAALAGALVIWGGTSLGAHQVASPSIASLALLASLGALGAGASGCDCVCALYERFGLDEEIPERSGIRLLCGTVAGLAGMIGLSRLGWFGPLPWLASAPVGVLLATVGWKIRDEPF
jgi:hypothetical protein